jgi:CDP-glycerol glycerophosphotransferase (TagB/SpsB family)
MQKKRILIPISFSFSIRYIVRTGLIDEIKKFAHPVIILTWNQEDLISELNLQGVEVHLLPEIKRDDIYANHRRKVDYWFNHFMSKSPSKKIQQKFLAKQNTSQVKLVSRLREKYNIVKMYLPGAKEKLFAKEATILSKHTDYENVIKWVQNLNADTVFTVTPFHAQEDIFLRACKSIGLKMLTAILSFDNITKRGWIPVEYDVYMVWNKYNFNELKRIYPYTNKKKIVITGAPQFDFYWNKNYLLPITEWKKNVGIPLDNQRKIILYAGGPKSLFPNEPQYLKHIDEAITEGKIIGNPIVLFRCHPVDEVERWKKYLGNSSNVIFDISWTGDKNLLLANVTDADIAKLCSTLAYTDVHINLCSTMTVDGSAFSKPQIGPAYDDVLPVSAKLLKNMYWQEHFLPIIKTAGIKLAESKQQLIDYINQALDNPQDMIIAADKIINEIITFSDGQSTSRVVETIREEIQNDASV